MLGIRRISCRFSFRTWFERVITIQYKKYFTIFDFRIYPNDANFTHIITPSAHVPDDFDPGILLLIKKIFMNFWIPAFYFSPHRLTWNERNPIWQVQTNLKIPLKKSNKASTQKPQVKYIAENSTHKNTECLNIQICLQLLFALENLFIFVIQHRPCSANYE